jgi:hypothetical protein
VYPLVSLTIGIAWHLSRPHNEAVRDTRETKLRVKQKGTAHTHVHAQPQATLLVMLMAQLAK